MSGFELEPMDGGTSIPLPLGETLVGRGAFLRVSDKRVSRNHGLLRNQGGMLHLKPTHLNPCFCQSSLEDLPEPLEKDQWHPLLPGHLFSLLPGKHIYRVVFVGTESTLRNSQPFEEEKPIEKSASAVIEINEEPLHVSGFNGQSDPIKSAAEPQEPESTLGNFRKEEEDRVISLKRNNTADLSSGKESWPGIEEKKRVLPAWMVANTVDVKSLTTSKDGKRGRGKAAPSQVKNPKAKRARDRRVSSGSDESELSEVEQANRKRAKRNGSEDDDENKSQRASCSASTSKQPARPSRDLGSEESDSVGFELSGDEEVSKAATLKSRRKAESADSGEKEGQSRNTETGSAEGSADESSSARVEPRAPCPYGKACYRKNQIHFQQCSHPGDSDYVEEVGDDEDQEDDNRPECPYGTKCYRKNPQHKKEYKHTKDPDERTSPGRGDPEPDDGDSFIDDESEGIDEDSDYAPTTTA